MSRLCHAYATRMTRVCHAEEERISLLQFPSLLPVQRIMEGMTDALSVTLMPRVCHAYVTQEERISLLQFPSLLPVQKIMEGMTDLEREMAAAPAAPTLSGAWPSALESPKTITIKARILAALVHDPT
eukprot:1299971-Pyramimonas_sp.AAC.1